MSSLAQKQVQRSIAPSRKKVTRVQKQVKKGITKGEKIIYSLFIGVFVIGLYLIISNFASIYLTNYEIQKNETFIEEQLHVNEGLELQVKELSDPVRILAEAEKMGMVLNEENVKYTQSNE